VQQSTAHAFLATINQGLYVKALSGEGYLKRAKSSGWNPIQGCGWYGPGPVLLLPGNNSEMNKVGLVGWRGAGDKLCCFGKTSHTNSAVTCAQPPPFISAVARRHMIGTLFLRPLHHQPHGEPSADPFLLLSLVLGELTNVRESLSQCGQMTRVLIYIICAQCHDLINGSWSPRIVDYGVHENLKFAVLVLVTMRELFACWAACS
jgi:hypothetical protein